MDGSLLSRRRTRRALVAGGLAAVIGGVAAALGVHTRLEDERAGQGGAPRLTFDDRDPIARPVWVRAPTPTPTQPPTPTPTPTPIPTATPTPTPEPTAPPSPPWDRGSLPAVLASGPTGAPRVALTIDDGWSARDEVLATLQELRAKATFFLAGRAVASDPGFIARALDAGMEIANHTWDHYLLTDKSFEYIQNDILQLEQFVRDAAPGAVMAPFMRPSGGAYNETVVAAAASLGYRVVLWSGSSGDGLQSVTPEQMIANLLAAARPGAILLAHFGPKLRAALPAAVEGLRGLGLEPVTLSELLASS